MQENQQALWLPEVGTRVLYNPGRLKRGIRMAGVVCEVMGYVHGPRARIRLHNGPVKYVKPQFLEPIE